MEQGLDNRSVSTNELKRSPRTELEQFNTGLRRAVQAGIDSGQAIPAEDVFAELKARYA